MLCSRFLQQTELYGEFGVGLLLRRDFLGKRQQTDMSALRRGRERERIARGRRSATVGCHSKRLRFLGKGDRSLSVAVFPRFPTEMNQERGKNGIKTDFSERSGKCPSLKSPL